MQLEVEVEFALENCQWSKTLKDNCTSQKCSKYRGTGGIPPPWLWTPM